MASEVEICNLALSHLGDTATVASLEPPEGSAQAEHCARFYPMARDALLEMHAWNFATRRVVPAELANNWTQWAHAYAKPADCLRVLGVMHRLATDDFTMSTGMPLQGVATEVPYSLEVGDDLQDVLYTNQEEAAIRYVARVVDTAKFSPIFVLTLSHYLASMLAGPLLKGDVGKAEAKAQMQLMQVWLAQARQADASQRHLEVQPAVPWITRR